MADERDGVIFTGEFDPSEIVKGIDQMAAGLKSMQDRSVTLNKELAETEAQINENKTAIQNLFKAQQSVDKNDKDRLTTFQNLNKQIDALTTKNTTLTTNLTKQREELSKNTTTVTAMTKAYDNAKIAVTNFNKEGANIGNSISGTKLFGKLDEVKGKVTDTFKNQLPNIISSSGAGIEGVLGSLGGSFGVFGLAAATALTPIIAKLLEMGDAQKQAQITSEGLQRIQKNGLANAAEETAKLKTLYEITQDQTQSLKDRNKAVDELQQLYPSYFANLSNEAILAGKAASAYERLTQAIIKRGLAEAVKQEIVNIQKEILPSLQNLSQAEKQKASVDKNGIAKPDTKAGFTRLASGNLVPNKIDLSSTDEDKQAAKDAIDRKFAEDKKIVDVANERIKKYIETVGAGALIDSYDSENGKSKVAKKVSSNKNAVVNIYEQELQKLKADIAKLDEKGFTDEATITKAIEEDFKKRELAFDKAFNKKQLTRPQLESLKSNLQDLQTLTLNKQLKDFNEQKNAFLKRINDEIDNANNEVNLRRIANIQDAFEKEAQAIASETDKAATKTKQTRDKLIADIKKDAAKNGLKPTDIQPQIDAIKLAYDSLLDELEIRKQQRLQQLSFDTFESLSKETKRVLDAGNLGISEGSLVRIQEQTALFQSGKISYKEYQRELTKIARFEAQERFNIEKLFLESEIRVRQLKLDTDTKLTKDQIQQLKDEIAALRQRLVSATAANEQSDAANENSDTKERISKFVDYANAILSITNSIVSFWQKANEAEQKALDRSISLQQKRVDAARIVASRGNAEYLRLEEERLKELEIKRENSAKRQLAINAALQASSIVTALITGIAKAVEVGGPLGALIGLGAVVAAITGAFAIAESLKPQTPSFFVGTEDTGHGGKEDNKGGFKAILHPHERVMTAEQNKKIGSLSNEAIVSLVQNYKGKTTPQLNLAAIDRANNQTTTSSIATTLLMDETNKKLDESNQLMRANLRALKSLGVNVTMDRNGIAVSVLEATEEILRDKKS